MAVLDDPGIRAALAKAWLDSAAGTPAAHEEGGFVLREANGALQVVRWPRGTETVVHVPAHDGGSFRGKPIIASFHTHPHSGAEYRPGPSLIDVVTIVTDKNLQHQDFEGEYVIGVERIWRMLASGIVEDLGERAVLLQ
jgi:hypothetical protein